ncbi:hypothetical protein J6590_011121 [Homalodisca vitripennis]|nr:hypothetical protein J6590_011121 [Homalodisca vitripennis]
MPGNAMDEDEPVATARPVRGRELRTMGIHTQRIDEPTGGEVYYEGFMDGKRYMVPDSNLEAMKDMINFTMRRRVSLRYKHQTSYDLGEYDHFNEMLQNLLKKFEGIDSISSTPGNSVDTGSFVSDIKTEPSDSEEKTRKEDGMEKDTNRSSVSSSLERDKEEQIEPNEKGTPSCLEDDKKQLVKEDHPEDTPMPLEKEPNNISNFQSEKTPSNSGGKLSKDELYPQNAPPKLHDKDDKVAEISEENRSLHSDNKKRKSSIPDIMDLDEKEPVITNDEKKHPNSGNKIEKSKGEDVDNKMSSLNEDGKAPLHSGSDLLDYGAGKGPLTFDSKTKIPIKTDEKNGTIYLDNRKGRPSILDIIDLDEEEPVKTYGEGKFPKKSDKTEMPQVADKRAASLVEGNKTPIHPDFEERHQIRESEIGRSGELDRLKSGGRDIVSSKLWERGRYFSTRNNIKDSVGYNAQKGRITLDGIRKNQIQLESQKRVTMDHIAGKGRLTLDCMRNTPNIMDEKYGTIYLDNKIVKQSILDIIDLDDEESVEISEEKYANKGDRIEMPIGEVVDNRASNLVEGKKTPSHTGFEERRQIRESDISKQVKPGVFEEEIEDLIPSNLDTDGRSTDKRIKNSLNYSAEKGPSTLDNTSKTYQNQLASEKRGMTDSKGYNAGSGALRFNSLKNRSTQFGSEKLSIPVGEDKKDKKMGPDITNGRLMPRKADSEKSRFVLKSRQQPITLDESLNNDLQNGKIENRSPMEMGGEKKYLQIGDGVGMPLCEVSDESLKEKRSSPSHPEPGERPPARDNGRSKPGESGSRETPPEKDGERKPPLPPHGNGNGFKGHEDSGRDEKESEDASISSVDDTEEYRVRLLISGHFHPDETPMFIIQEYEAESGVFDDQIVDIKRIQNVGDVDINIAGKFYNDTIIRERDDKSLFLNIKPLKIEIDHLNSKIYYDKFEESFKIENLVDVVLKGQFVASTLTREITPVLSFNIKKLGLGSVSSDSVTKKNPRLDITRFDQAVVNKSNPYNSENAVVNIVRVANNGYGKIADKVGSSYFDNEDELTISRTSITNFGSLELTVDDWHAKPPGLYSYLPVIPLSLQKSLTGSELEIVEVGENEEIENSPQIKNRRGRKEMRQGEKTKKGANRSNAEDTEYICRIKDYRPAKRKFFNLF